MTKTIALFNHKGGVSKTTTTFNLGWMLTKRGHRVVMIDTDPQCNLTGLVLGYEDGEEFDNFYKKFPKRNIYSALEPAFQAQPRMIEPVECVKVKGREGLFLLPGHVNLSEYEVTLGIAQELSGSLQALRNLPGSFHYLINKVANAANADYVLIDMSPSLGAINQNLLMTSDLFLVPSAPDYFSLLAIDSLTSILPKWMDWAKRAHQLEALRSAAYPFPELRLKFLGTVIQKYRPRKGKATEGFQSWIDDINKKVVTSLFPKLKEYNATFPEKVYEKSGLKPADSYCLAQIPDLNTLIATSQTHQTPVFALKDNMFGHTGTVLAQDKQKREEFLGIFKLMAKRVIALAENA